MNTYVKYYPNVFVAKCDEKYEKGEEILMTTRHGKEIACIVFNLLKSDGDTHYYSIVRADGFNSQERAKKKAEKYSGYANNAESRSDEYYRKSNKDRDFLSLGEPIKVGHHSEKRHRKAIDQARNNLGKSVEEKQKAQKYEDKAEYRKDQADKIDLSMPESLEYFTYKLEEAEKVHKGLKDGTIERKHSYSLTYAKKAVNDLKKKVEIAERLRG